MIPFPAINPVFLSVGPFSFHWYGLMYALSFLICYTIIARASKQGRIPLTEVQVSDLLFVVFLGIFVGGRLGYVLFYNLSHYIANPAQILAVWEGGMSFHGALLGVAIAILLYSAIKKLSPITIGDSIIVPIPIALGLGRIGNFINGELYGKATEVPWCMVFPNGGDLCRHPSQLYHVLGEGLVLFVILLVLSRRKPPQGVLLGAFLLGYSILRTITELFREPDSHIGYLWDMITMGQLLTIPMFILGIWLIVRGYRRTS